MAEAQDQFNSLQSKLSDLVNTRQKLQAQQSENESVSKEFESLSDDAGIYKLLGPVLLKQERAEAKMAVAGRLEFIAAEIKRVDGNINDLQEQSDKLRNEAQLQQQEQEGGKNPQAVTA